ncbi:tropomyosin Tod p 1.0102 isoform X9 [Octopus bimaculoides]|uniref:tropomyosin Tod p 1.0102 isoform X3 n=1 Tax=Octopus bimaculoides TaxID=37653 RepID=UPI00071DDF4C|nr:tropomyosin Tod p 1.0102 isoform X3 [Octopus bimaculoides]XP_014773973.1 tropomyosin Tod p 1.0102 isoform X3 [Octopus bimaculoides]XP_014773974.1 tropomyosin Tod p 1.0102 isoform X9 [Octopus bimaculoides]|eukprot:XP_014773965.1 PREDICTED: tropomyosin-2-like isoform X4 [Octopus bimaculoides]
MGEKCPAEPDLCDVEGVDLSQESLGTLESDQGIVGSQDSYTSILPEDGAKVKKKKKDGKKTKKKKSSKSKSKDGDSKDSDGKEHKTKKSSSSRRPEPEGGNTTSNVTMDEFDKVIYNNDPLFSDLELSDKEGDSELQVPSRQRRQTRLMGVGSSGIVIPCTQFGLNSNTMIKFAIISTELQNVLQVSLKRCESEIAGLNRRIQLLEEDLERSEERLSTAQTKLDEASKAADESERGRKVLENRSQGDEERIDLLEKQLEEAKWIAEDADRKFDEAARKLAITEVDLERAEARLEAAEAKIVELEEELKVVGNNMKSLEISEQEASQREDSYEETIRDLTHRLKEAENRTECAERECNLLHKGKAVLEGDLEKEQLKTKKLQEEMQQTYMEIHELMQ